MKVGKVYVTCCACGPFDMTSSLQKGLQAVATLHAQYRMAGDIMRLANMLIYDGRLRAGSQAVEEACLKLELPPMRLVALPPWLQEARPPISL